MARSATWLLTLTCSTAVSACSLLTTWDDVRLGALDADAGAIDGGAIDAGADVAATDAGPVDAGSDACTPGTVVCLDSADTTGSTGPALYACTDAGTYAPPVSCLHMCVHTATGVDLCSCNLGDTYCGGDNVIGDPGSLYECQGNAPPTLKEKCSINCVVHPGANDQCNL